ncbi:MAG: protein-L-isoaspartate(D-aspartate) O-methyltransferase [Candidatus Binatia bacterium]
MTEKYSLERDKMIREQLAARQIRDPKVIEAMRAVPRHLFVPDEVKSNAYEDRPLPIGKDQTISQPYMVALMVQALELNGNEKVLEIGTGSGYETAILAELSAQVFSIERLEDLAARAQTLLAALGYQNIRIKVGDGTLGWQEHAPYDAIVITASSPQIPRPLIEQLHPNGIFILPMGEEQLQSLVRLRKSKDGIREEYLGECRFVKLRGAYGWEE